MSHSRAGSHPCVAGTAPITLVPTVQISPFLSSGARSRGALLALACTFAGTLAHADPPSPPGADALVTARAEWGGEALCSGGALVKSALDQGGLSPADTLEAYVHLGSARARHGKKELARAAFRQAALIDSHFKTPSEGGKRAARIAAQARHDEAKLGLIVLKATAPESVPSGEPFGVDATLDPKHAAVTAKVGLDALDSLSGKHWATTNVAATKMHFDVPASVTSPGVTLLVRIDALNPHNNRLASYEQRVRVEALPPSPAVVELTPKPVAVPLVAPAPATLTFTTDLGGSKQPKETAKHGGDLFVTLVLHHRRRGPRRRRRIRLLRAPPK